MYTQALDTHGKEPVPPVGGEADQAAEGDGPATWSDGIPKDGDEQ